MFRLKVCYCYYIFIVILGTRRNGIYTHAANQNPTETATRHSNTYITDIMDELYDQKWPHNGQLCLNQTITMLSGVQNHTLWSTWAWESMYNLPIGQLYGSRHHLGNYDECVTSSWAASKPDLRTQYCLANVVLYVNKDVRKNVTTVNPYASTLDYLQYHTRYSRHIDRFVWGLCVPISCSTESARVFAGVMLQRSPWNVPGLTANVTIDQCQDPFGTKTWMSYDIGLFVFCGIVLILVFTSVLCTVIVDCKGKHPDEMLWYYLRAFNIKENSKTLLHYTEDNLSSLYGIRFLSIALIVMGHQIMYYNIGPISNGWKADQELDSGMANLVIHDDVIVDTFFFMSGVLYIRTVLFLKKIPSTIGALMKRYLRLAPSLAMVILYITTTLKYTGSGPLWPNYVKQESGYCSKNWWTNLLMVNNFVNPENMCYHNTWYIPCDFQMFVCALLLTQLTSLHHRLGQGAFWALSVLSVLVPGFITYYYDLPPLPLMVYETLLDSRNSMPLNMFYIKTYNRIGPYLVGLTSGRILCAEKKPDKRNRKNVALAYALTGLLMMLGVLLYGAHMHRNGWSKIESVVFAALNRIVWAGGLGLVLLGCSYDEVPIIKSILTWYPWVPLSKLAFGIYITHGLVIYRNIFVTRNLHHHDNGNIGIDTMGVLVWSTILAYLLWIFVEAPISNIFNILMTPRKMLEKMVNRELTKEDIQLALQDPKGAIADKRKPVPNIRVQISDICSIEPRTT